MAHSFHHLHLRAQDPRKTAQWYVDMFEARAFGERDIRGAVSVPVKLGDITLTISGPRAGEDLAASSDNVRWGLDHFAVGTSDLAGDLDKLRKAGAKVLDEVTSPTGPRIAFIAGPDSVRIELMQV